jgi:hypothetical protein
VSALVIRLTAPIQDSSDSAELVNAKGLNVRRSGAVHAQQRQAIGLQEIRRTAKTVRDAEGHVIVAVARDNAPLH